MRLAKVMITFRHLFECWNYNHPWEPNLFLLKLLGDNECIHINSLKLFAYTVCLIPLPDSPGRHSNMNSSWQCHNLLIPLANIIKMFRACVNFKLNNFFYVV